MQGPGVAEVRVFRLHQLDQFLCAAEAPDLYIGPEKFRETFCADVPVDRAEVMFATQRPLSLAALTENATAAGWKTAPSWFLVSEHDNAIPPDCERFMAERMGQRRDPSPGPTPRLSLNRSLWPNSSAKPSPPPNRHPRHPRHRTHPPPRLRPMPHTNP